MLSFIKMGIALQEGEFEIGCPCHEIDLNNNCF